MVIAAITAFVVLLSTGVILEAYTARSGVAGGLRHRLTGVFSTLWQHPGRLVRWVQHRQEESYHPPRPGKRQSLAKWAIRLHIAVLIPLAAYFGAGALERLAEADKPIFGLYFSPLQAWYMGALTGAVTAAVAPLVAYIIFWFVIVLPYTLVSMTARRIGRILIEATDGESGRDQAPLAILGAVLGLACAAVLLSL